MTIQVLMGQEVIFSTGDGENVLVPFDESERAKAFYALSGALALLCGATPLYPHDAKATGSDEHSAESGQYQSGHTGGVVLPLRARPADPISS
jgi:hypothetical protein